MKTLGQIFNMEDNTSRKLVAITEPSKDTNKHVGKSEKEQNKRLQIVNDEQIEETYLYDAVVNRGIECSVLAMISSGYTLTDAKKSTLKLFYEFINNSHFDEWLEESSRLEFKHGWSVSELVKKGKEIVDLTCLSPLNTVFAKDMSGNYKVDGYGNPLEFVQKLTSAKGGMSELKFPSDSVLYIPLKKASDLVTPIGLISPIYGLSVSKVNIEKGLGEVIIRLAYPKYYAEVGDQMHDPTPDMLDDLADKLASLDYESVLSVPYYQKVQILEPKRTQVLREQLDYFNDQEISELGVPKAYLTMGGEATNRSTLKNLNDFFERSIKFYQHKKSHRIENYLFKRLSEQWGLTEYPRFTWNNVDLDSLDEKATRIHKYLASRAMTPDAGLEAMIRASEGMPVLDASTVREPIKKSFPVEETDRDELPMKKVKKVSRVETPDED